MDAVEQAKSGHSGMPMGMADAATVLWSRFLKFDPAQPDWPDRDRFVLSAGHGSMLLYALLRLTGYLGADMAEPASTDTLRLKNRKAPRYDAGLINEILRIWRTDLELLRPPLMSALCRRRQ